VLAVHQNVKVAAECKSCSMQYALVTQVGVLLGCATQGDGQTRAAAVAAVRGRCHPDITTINDTYFVGGHVNTDHCSWHSMSCHRIFANCAVVSINWMTERAEESFRFCSVTLH
jgi:hypothetical protein